MGHGQVRCGKCRTQFDALDSLLDDEESPAEPAKDAPTRATSEHQSDQLGIEAEEPAIAEEITLEGSRIEISGTYRVPGDNGDRGSGNSAEQIIREHVVIDREAPNAESQRDAMDDDAAAEDQYIEINPDDGEPVAEAAHHLLSDSGLSETAEQTDTEELPLSQRLWKRARPQRRDAATEQIDAELHALTRPQSRPTGTQR
jgi:hypothetical protein